MKRIILFCGLLFFLLSCNNNSTSNKSNSTEESIKDEQVKLTSETKESKSEETLGEVKKCGPFKLDVYINDDSATNVRKKPDGAVLLKLKQDANYMLTVVEVKNGWFKAENPIGGHLEDEIQLPKGEEAWMHGSVLAVDTRNYGGKDLNLLDQPKNGKVVGVIEEESGGISLKDVCGRWVQVDYKGVIGWIEDVWLCGNPATNCN